uniref:RNase H type-1 domain-containing protein n=1 Tax=Populus alba TaxID=43335 RepID=A0A4U5QEH6_POPAL|nr:uncharacterized protein D5086_0000103910 [Populus alba]
MNPFFLPPPSPISFIPFPPSKPYLGASSSSLLPSTSSLLSRHKHWDSLEKKPPLGFVKLNTDASYKYNCSRSSVAGVCRDEHGVWLLGFSSRVKSGSAFESELLAVREALKLAWDKGLKRVIVESDSESVVNRIRNQLTRRPKNQIEAVILERQSYVSREWNCFLQHAHREGNFDADALTKIIISESFELHVFNHPPRSLSLILLADKIGMAVPRHGALDRNQIAHLKVLRRELLARKLHWKLAQYEPLLSSPAVANFIHPFPPSKPYLGASSSSLTAIHLLTSFPSQTLGFTGKKPPLGFVKLNTDASYKYNCSRSSVAGVCRDEHGVWLLGFSSRVKSGSAFESELLAVREALKLAWDKGLKRVIVESDSESVVNRIRNQLTRRPKNQIEAVILERQSYVSREWNCFLQHAHREGNFDADALTKIIISESFELHVFNHPPRSLSLILLA